MKKVWIVYLFFMFTCLSSVYAAGGITHMYLSQEAVKQLPDPTLRELLLENFDAYLVGSYYPDSGYISGTTHGEVSHWDPFIDAFAKYIKDTYPNPIKSNPRLIAFLFGCASHRVADEIIHRTFYPIVAEHDFKNDRNQAHGHGDAGIDLLLNLDRNLWTLAPLRWWVPVHDLLAIYERMKEPGITAHQIKWGNAALMIAGFTERLIALPSYPYLKLRMPWTAKHYFLHPVGGLEMITKKISLYQMDLWHQFKDTSLVKHPP
ncbi:MAG: zinc dependent phospholipase C family protein [Gammaproteobacteria bacterium]|nr:zinc dependent phospholipase C family protein [Gammaproteobacteria bacterium]